MPAIIPNQGEEVILDAIVASGLELRLYTDDHVDAEPDTAASFTDATFTGYAAETLTAGSFVQSIGADSTMTYPQITYTTTDVAPQSIFGYYVVQTSTGKVLLAEKFSDGPKDIVAGGAPFNLTFILRLLAEV